jgi:transcriptional regulator with XRE-family HTH domain
MVNTVDNVTQPAIARRLRAICAEMGVEATQLAKRLGYGRTRVANWLREDTGNMPAEEAMAALCDMMPGLTLDYIYRGSLDHVPHALAIRLTAWETGLNPDQPAPRG